MKNNIWFALLILLAINGCNNNNNSMDEYEKATLYCLEQNGTVIKDDISDDSFCKYSQTYDYDDGAQTYTFTCELYTFYNGTCDQIENEEDINEPILDVSQNDNLTIRETFYSQVLQVLNKLDYTGYTHHSAKEGPFVLQPNYTELLTKNDENHIVPNHNIANYNLFLDCSGFVGYYIIQGIAKHLYSEVGRCYHPPHKKPPSRPLAADFADAFADASANGLSIGEPGVREATIRDLETNASTVKWGRVRHIKDAKPGDIIVYKDNNHIIKTNGICDNTTDGNTGHILFIMKTPKHTTKESYGNEWLVSVADSTTSPHSHDSRFSNINHTIKKHSNIINKSKYKVLGEVKNKYTSWTLRYKNDWMEQCGEEDTKPFHRRCKKRVQKILLQTSNIQSSTGVGIGYIYISDDMKSYRVRNHAHLKRSDVYIGRPVVYTPSINK